MEGEGEVYAEAPEELVGSWQDLRGRDGLEEEGRWESIAGGRHQDVVALDAVLLSPKKASLPGGIDNFEKEPLMGESLCS